MKMERISLFFRACLALLALADLATSSAAAEPFARLKSVRIESTNVVVEAEASTDFTKATLESSTRLGRRGWMPRAVHLINNSGAVDNFTFTLPLTPELEILRIRGDRTTDTLPAEFYTGTNKFDVAGGALPSGQFDGGAGGPATSGPNAPGGDRDSGAPPRDVAESDIWKLVGDTLFFFNQYRGLQVIDVSDPNEPVVTGTYDLAGAGEQMYVINGTNVVLLARDNCSWWGTDSLSRIVLLQVRNGEPHLVKELPVPGQVAESRMVGSALYLVANSYQRRIIPATDVRPAYEEMDYGSDIVSFDLSDFATASEKSRDWVRGYGNVIMATDKYLFLAQQNYENETVKSLVHSYDISSPNGAFTKLAAFDSGGEVKDKFKMHITGDTFVVVVQKRGRSSTGQWTLSVNARTFSFANPAAPKLLADLKIIENETLFATRFDGNRLYAVTFLRIDPLWIIDLSNPAAPKKVGELQIPGWSTFLQPLGDRLLAIGLDQDAGFRTAVQLFNVADPANPTLLSKVILGDSWSGSEANWDEKAFGVLSEENLVLVPFYSSGPQGYFEGVQLIDLEENRLVKRGAVPHKMGARRATVHRERLLSLSSHSLLSVDIDDRNNPTVINTLELSWAADRVHLVGDFLIEVDSNSSTAPILRVVDASDPSIVRTITVLTNLPYLGSTVVDGALYVLQGRASYNDYVVDPLTGQTLPTPIVQGGFVLSTLPLQTLPALSVSAVAQKTSEYGVYFNQFNALEVRDDLLVWASTFAGYRFYPWMDVALGGPASGGVGVSAPMSDRFAPWPAYGGSGHLVAVDLSGAQAVFASEVKVAGTNQWWNFGEAFTAGGLVFTSHQASEFDPTIDPPPVVYQTYDGKGTVVTNDPPPGVWVQRYYLDVVDFADAADPLIRPPVNIPGSLIGLHRAGELLYTRGYEGSPFNYSGEEHLSASAYDGVAAHKVDSIALKSAWPRPAKSADGVIYLGVPAFDATTKSALEVWTVPASGKFELLKSVPLDSAAQEIRNINDLLVVQNDNIELYDARNPATLPRIGSGNASMCYGLLLDGADGAVDRGVWLPVGWYGVLYIPIDVSPVAQ